MFRFSSALAIRQDKKEIKGTSEVSVVNCNITKTLLEREQNHTQKQVVDKLKTQKKQYTKVKNHNIIEVERLELNGPMRHAT